MHPRHAAKVANSGGFEKTEDEVSRNLGEILDRSDGLRNKFETSQHQHDIKNLYIASSRNTQRKLSGRRVVRVEAQLRTIF